MMNMAHSIIDRMPERADKPPYLDLMVLVECDGVRHVANQDASGKWRTLSRRKELKGVVQVVKVVR
jgi:hypothetical protein